MCIFLRKSEIIFRFTEYSGFFLYLCIRKGLKITSYNYKIISTLQ